MRDLYKILGIPRDADQATIRKAFKKLARKYHPDLNKDKGAGDRFKEINTAYEVLGDEERRNAYDTFGEAALKPGFDPGRARQWREAAGGFGGGRGGFGGGGFGGGGFGGGGFGGMDIEELLKNFGGRQRGSSPRPRPAQSRGADIEQPLSCTLEQLVAGDGIPVSIRRPASCNDCSGKGGEGRQRCGACSGSGDTKVGPVKFPCVACSGAGHRFQSECGTCEGTGRTMKDERLKVRVPAGVKDGQTIRLRGKGAEGKRKAAAGDLLLAVHIQTHKMYERDGADVRLSVPLTIHEAMVGAQIKVPTLHGAIKVKIPSEVTAGQQMRIKGRGLPKKGGKNGDLYLILQPSPPDSTDDAIKLAQALESHYPADIRADWEQ